jgi:hypothetical protein
MTQISPEVQHLKTDIMLSSYRFALDIQEGALALLTLKLSI